MGTDEFATEPQSHRVRWREKALLPVFMTFSLCLCVSVAWTKNQAGRSSRVDRLSGLSSRRVLFSLFFVSNFETDLWDQVLPLDQSQRLVFQHAGGLGVQFRFAQFFVLPVSKKQQIDRAAVVRRFADWFTNRFGLCRFGLCFCGGRFLKRRVGYFRCRQFWFGGFFVPKVQHGSFDLP